MSKIRVLQFSSRSSDNCGVGKYEENFMDIYKFEADEIETKFFEYSPYQTRLMGQDELNEVMEKLKEELKDYDILHIQHEFGLYSGSEFAQLVDTAKSVGKKVVITVHLSPELAFKFKPRGGIGPRSIMHVLRQRRLHKSLSSATSNLISSGSRYFTQQWYDQQPREVWYCSREHPSI